MYRHNLRELSDLEFDNLWQAAIVRHDEATCTLCENELLRRQNGGRVGPSPLLDDLTQRLKAKQS